MKTDRRHLSPGIRRVIDAFETSDFSAIEPAFGPEGMSILRRWWRGENLGISPVVGDIFSYMGVLGKKSILSQARLACFRAGAKVLDVACGIGGPGRILARHFHCFVHGIDIDPECILVARGFSKLEGLENLATFEVGDRAAVPAKDRSFDLVWGHGGWGFNDDCKTVLREAFRVLRPGGQVCCPGLLEELEWFRDLGFAKVEFHDDRPQQKKAFTLFLQALDEQKREIVDRAGEQVWTMFYSQKTRQLEEQEKGKHSGIAVATK